MADTTGGRPPKLTPEEQARFKRLARLSTKELMAQFRLSRAATNRYRRRLGTGPHSRQRTRVSVLEVRLLLIDEHSHARAAARLGVNEKTVARILSTPVYRCPECGGISATPDHSGHLHLAGATHGTR